MVAVQITQTCKSEENIVNIRIKLLGLSITLLMGVNYALASQSSNDDLETGQDIEKFVPGAPYSLRGFAGHYLSSHFAQSQNDWGVARGYLDSVLSKDPENKDLLKRAMILAMGSGKIDLAVKRAKDLINQDNDVSLAMLIVTIDLMSQGNLEGAKKYLTDMPEGDMTDFLRPILIGWIDAENRELELNKDFGETSIHMYHAALMSFFANDTQNAQLYTDKLLELEGLSVYEGERIADLQVALGHEQEALGFYKGLLVQGSTSSSLSLKIGAVQNQKIESVKHLMAPLYISSAAQGAALSMLDMSRILYQEHSDSSSKLFSNIALALDPRLDEAHLLLANTLSRNGRINEALHHYKSISKDSPLYNEAQHLAADALANNDRVSEAQGILKDLYESDSDIDALIRVGDLYRQLEDYESALEVYIKSAHELGDKLDSSYWYLLYARGMAYERLGQWDLAEPDLKKALEYKPENPYLMNYLGYGWADQGLYLDQSLELIEKAVSLRPSDGYITDSLGWVHYMMGNYHEALPYLERAVELLPYDPVINDHLGDVYWKVGRRLEAKYQWERAHNHSEEEKLKEKIKHKLKYGITKETNALETKQNETKKESL